MLARAGNGLRPYPGLRKRRSPRSKENRYGSLVLMFWAQEIEEGFDRVERDR